MPSKQQLTSSLLQRGGWGLSCFGNTNGIEHFRVTNNYWIFPIIGFIFKVRFTEKYF